MKTITIGTLAKEANTTLRSIRYYSECGLLTSFSKNKNGHAEFTDKSLDVLKKIKNLKEAGFTLKEIKDILDAINSNNTSNKDRTMFLLKILNEHKTIILERERELSNIRKSLDNVLEKTSSCIECQPKDCFGCNNLTLLETLGIKERI